MRRQGAGPAIGGGAEHEARVRRGRPPGVRGAAAVLSAALLAAAAMLRAAAGAAADPAPVVFRWETESGRDAAAVCARVWAADGSQLSQALLADAPAETILCLVPGGQAFAARFGGMLPDWGVGVALGPRLVALDPSRLSEIGRGLREVFLHEMAHALILQGSAQARMPAWFHEGAAMQYSGEWRFVDTVSLALDGRVPDLARLQGRWPQTAERADRAYRASLLAVGRLLSRHGQDAVTRVIRQTRLSGSFDEGFLAATGETPAAFAEDFRRAMRLRFAWVTVLTRWPGLFALLGCVLIIGGLRKVAMQRRRLAAMDDEEFPE